MDGTLGTRRQQITALLRHGSRTILEVSRAVGAPVRSVLDDLEHVRRGLRGRDRWVVLPAECLNCGFLFRGRERLSTPSRCPRCKSEDIEEARFEIRQEG